MNKKLLLLSCAASVLALSWTAAEAQATRGRPVNTGAQDTSNATTVGELVITAEKREQTLQTVPVAVSAYTAAKRQLIGIDTIQDMTNFTPGLEYNTSTDRISLRGVGRLTNVLSADASVANYSDGIYETFAVGAGASTLFLDRVEILRGPQGTLYGRASIGGAINEISRRPTKDWYAEGRFTYGNYHHFNVEGAISGPVTDWLQVRLAGNWEKQTEGYITNIVPGMPSEGNVIDQKFVEAQFQAQFSPKFDAWAKIGFNEWNNGAGGPGATAEGWTPYPYVTSEASTTGIQLNPGYPCNPASGATNVVNASPSGCYNPEQKSPWLTARSIPYSVQLPDAFTVASQFTYHAPGFDIKYITGGVRYHYILNGPSEGALVQGVQAPITSYTIPGAFGTPGLVIDPLTDFRYQEFNASWSHEVDFVSTTNSPFQYLFGLYYFTQQEQQPVYTEDAGQPQLNTIFPGTCAIPKTGCVGQTDYRLFDNRPDIHDQSAAGFGQIDWKITPTIKVTGGARYSTDRKYGTESVRLNCFAVTACYAPAEDNAIVGGLPTVDLTQVGTVVDTVAGGPGVVGAPTINPQTDFITRTYAAHWQAFTGTLGVEWTPDSDTLLYGKYSRGYKSGGLNIGIYTVLSYFPWTEAETVNSFEVGFKKTFFHTLTTDVAAFYYRYDNLQIPITIGAVTGGLSQATTAFYNVPTSISEGVELETTWQPTKNISLLFNYSYLNAYATSGAVIDPADPDALAPGAKPIACSSTPPAAASGPTPCTVDVYTGGLQRYQSLNGSQLPNAPKNKIALSGTYTFFFEPGTLSLTGSYVWRDVQYGTLFSRSYNEAPAWDQIDARVTWTAANGKYKVIVFGKNIFNTIGYDSGAYGERLAGSNDVLSSGTYPFYSTVNYVQSPGIVKTYFVNPPRTYGVEIDYKFF